MIEPKDIPIVFNQHNAIMRWHEQGRPWRNSDLRIDFVVTLGAKWCRVMHVPTGMSAESKGNTVDAITEALRVHAQQRADAAILRDRHGAN